MTLQKALAMADLVRPNPFDEETKTAWLNEVEGVIGTEVLNLAADAVPVYTYADDAEKTLAITPPHDKLYYLYLCAMIDQALGEIDRYENSMALYNAAESEFAKWYARHHRADGTWNRGPGLTAYQLAASLGIRENDEGFLRAMADAVALCRSAAESASRVSIAVEDVTNGVKITVTDQSGASTETVLQSESSGISHTLGSSAPTAATPGEVNDLYFYGGKMWVCASATENARTWVPFIRNTDFADAGLVGAVKIGMGAAYDGIISVNGEIMIDPASDYQIDHRNYTIYSKKPVTVAHLDYAVRSVAPETVTVVDLASLTPEGGKLYTGGVCTALSLTLPSSGEVGKDIYVRFRNGATACALTVNDTYSTEFTDVPGANCYSCLFAEWDPTYTEGTQTGRWVLHYSEVDA